MSDWSNLFQQNKVTVSERGCPMRLQKRLDWSSTVGIVKMQSVHEAMLTAVVK